MVTVFIFLLTLLGTYLLGSLPTGFIVTKYIKKIDIREFGSSSTGATNVFRALGLKWGILVAVIDIIKGAIPVLVGRELFNNEIMVILLGITAVAGHNWSIFINFKGGRGVATSAGVAIALVPLVFLIAIIFWLLVVRLSRYISLASILVAAIFPVLVYFLEESMVNFWFFLFLALLVIYQHRRNIVRLFKGEENRISKDKFRF